MPEAELRYGDQRQQSNSGKWYTFIGPIGWCGSHRYTAVCETLKLNGNNAGGFLITGLDKHGAFWLRGQHDLPALETLNIDIRHKAPRTPDELDASKRLTFVGQHISEGAKCRARKRRSSPARRYKLGEESEATPHVARRKRRRNARPMTEKEKNVAIAAALSKKYGVPVE